MRISDWSSDVCSSDLPELPREAHEAEAGIGRAIGHSGYEVDFAARRRADELEVRRFEILLLQEDLKKHLSAGLRLARYHRGALEVPQAADLPGIVGRHNQAAVTPGPFQKHRLGIAQRLGHVPGVRSEEHTSELQSLLRISYSVFCLNNKSTKNNL